MTSNGLEQAARPVPARHPLSKVPEVTVVFWITKVLTTGMGETTSDFLAHRFDPVIAVAFAGVALVAALTVQFSVRRYIAWVYWLAVVMVSIFGTMAADGLHVQLGIPYVVSTLFFFVVLVAIFGIWYASEKTLSIHSIHTRRREFFYWATVITTFALGTAVGDMSATTLHLGYFASGVVFAVVIAIPAVGHRWFRMAAIPAFWFAYIVTRPLGASFADWLGVPAARGGAGLGTGWVSVVLAVVIACLVGYLTATRRDVSTGDVTAR
jgi:uncharacterized membrane-anchored protein